MGSSETVNASLSGNGLAIVRRNRVFAVIILRPNYHVQNHYVPEFYFRPWLEGGTHLIRYGWMRGKLTRDPKTPGQICYIDDHHTFSRPMGQYGVNAVENWLTDQVDTFTAKVVARVIAGDLTLLSNAEANRLALFMQSLIVRHPVNKHLLMEKATEQFKRTMAVTDEKIAVEGGETAQRFGFSSLLDYTESVHPGLVENIGRFIMPEVIADRKYRQKLLEMDCWSIDFAGNSAAPLLTTDRPLTMLGKGLLDPDVVLILPLSPTVVLYQTSAGVRNRMLADGIGPLCVRTQKAVLRGAWRFAFGTRSSNTHLVERYLPRA